MKPRIVTCIAVLLCAIPAISAASSAETFDAAFKLIERLRQGEKLEIAVRLSGQEFSLLREESQAIDEAEFKTLVKESSGLPRLRLTADGEGFIYPLEKDRAVVQTTNRETKARTWGRESMVTAVSYPRALWGAFIAEAAKRGLAEYSEYGGDEQSFALMSFRQADPATFESAGKTLQFSDAFYTHMKLALTHPASKGSAGIAVLVHEPHDNVHGQFQMIPGLKAFADANPAQKIAHLVEGEYDGTSRNIPIASFATKLDHTRGSTPAEPMVYRLLARHVIDGPVAYRLLHDRTSPAIAIDDIQYLPPTSEGARPDTWQKTAEMMQRVLEAGDKYEGQEQEKVRMAVRLALLEASAYQNADAEDLHGQRVIDYYEGLSGTMSNLGELAGGLAEITSSTPLREASTFFRSQAAAYKREIKIYTDALQRDEKMAHYIITYARAGAYLPVAFIGSFHTDGITRRLRDAGIGYVVIEPRYYSAAPAEERAEFDSFLYQSSRAEAYRRLQQLRKLPVSPSGQEFDNYIVPTLEKDTAKAVTREAEAAARFAAIQDSAVERAALQDAMHRNGSLASAEIKIAATGGGGGAIPPRFKGSFAFFEPGGERGAGGSLVILDAKDSAWRDPARLNFIRDAVMLPLETAGIKSRGQTRIYQEVTTRQLFACHYHAESKRFYLFQGEDTLSLLTQIEPPRQKDSGDVLIRLHLTEIDPPAKKDSNG